MNDTKRKNNKEIIIVITSMGADPFHVGHIIYLKNARKLGDFLIVIINNDNWLMKKKGYVFMKEKERAEIISSIKGVDSVVLTGHKKNTRDMSVCKEIKQLIKFAHRKYKNCNINFIFAKGGDKTKNNIPEKDLCEKLGIKMKFGVGGYNKLQSSSRLVDKIRKYQINN